MDGSFVGRADLGAHHERAAGNPHHAVVLAADTGGGNVMAEGGTAAWFAGAVMRHDQKHADSDADGGDTNDHENCFAREVVLGVARARSWSGWRSRGPL